MIWKIIHSFEIIPDSPALRRAVDGAEKENTLNEMEICQLTIIWLSQLKICIFTEGVF